MPSRPRGGRETQGRVAGRNGEIGGRTHPACGREALPPPPACLRSAAPAAPPLPPASPPLGNAAAAPRSAGPPPISEIAGFRAARTLLTEIASPDPESRWRAGAAGVVHRIHRRRPHLDAPADRDHRQLHSGVFARSRRLLARRPRRHRAALHRRDDLAAAAFPEKVDLVAVQATDAKTATVTTSDGRRFSTTDGGATWSRLSPARIPRGSVLSRQTRIQFSRPQTAMVRLKPDATAV